MRRISLIVVLLATTILTARAQEVKSIIYLIGDGMGLSSVSMMQVEGGYEPTIFDRAENIALQKSYSMDNRVTDSAASGTALATGCKTNNTYLGVTAEGAVLENLMEVAHGEGKRTGLVVTTYLQHATPAAFYAHIPARHEYLAITDQLLASNIDVAIGGGMAFFKERYGEALQSVIAKSNFKLATSLDEVRNMSGKRALLALLADYEVGSNSGSYLADATSEALRILEEDRDGFVLMVEGSLIDGMGHANDAKAQQLEMQGFMAAIEVAVEYADSHPGTLVVVTADHSTGGLSIVSADADFTLSEQGVEYRWSTKGHSGEMIPIYLYGTGAESINGIMENADLGAKLKELIR